MQIDKTDRINNIKKYKEKIIKGMSDNIIIIFIKKFNKLKYTDTPDYSSLIKLLLSNISCSKTI